MFLFTQLHEICTRLLLLSIILVERTVCTSKAYRVVGNFVGTNFCEKGQNLGFRKFSVLIFTVGESGTHGLANGTAKS